MPYKTRLALDELHTEQKKRDRDNDNNSKRRQQEIKQLEQSDAVTQREMIFAVLPAAIEKETDGGTISSNKRNLFYTARPLWKELYGNVEIAYKRFSEVLTE